MMKSKKTKCNIHICEITVCCMFFFWMFCFAFFFSLLICFCFFFSLIVWLVLLFNFFLIIQAFRPRFECAPSANVNHSLYNESNYIIHENCQIKLYHNDTNGFELKSVQGCTHGYKYVLDKESTIVTEVNVKYFLTDQLKK